MNTSIWIEKSLGQVMIYGFISVLISSLSIYTWCFLDSCWFYDCLFLVCFVEWFCIMISKWNKHGFFRVLLVVSVYVMCCILQRV